MSFVDEATLSPNAPEVQKGADGVKFKPMKNTEDAPAPPFVNIRDTIFEGLKKERTTWTAQQPREKIEVLYIPRDGGPKRTLTATSWQSTPWTIAQAVSVRSQLDKLLVARVDGELHHLKRPLERNCNLELVSFNDAAGKECFWLSSAHILASAAERRFGCAVSSAEAGAAGFHLEWNMGPRSINKDEYKPLHRIAHKLINKGLEFEGLRVQKPGLLQLFSYNKYKLHAIEQLRDDESMEVYRCGDFIDISPQPLLVSTAGVKAFELTSNSSSYFLGDANNDTLQRMYGVSFPDKKSLEEHKEWVKQAALRDHRKIGKDQELFFFHSKISPGSAFFLPAGQRIYNTMMAYMREEYWKRGYSEVTTPNMFNSSLWKQSGHWEHYQDDMFRFEVEKDDWALKPMNCPGHCVLFDHRERTYRELPLRVAEFGVLHRNELSGALTGLTRVRRFVQDDTHIFCMPSQVEQEVKNVLDWLTDFYHRMFGFSFKVKLSTMPEKHLGDIETWQRAEEQLIKALDGLKQDTGVDWALNPGDGAFYGPKIDIAICDALKRDHQCASIQLDFQLPQQFNLQYRTDEQAAPVKKTAKTGKTIGAENKKRYSAHLTNGHGATRTDSKTFDDMTKMGFDLETANGHDVDSCSVNNVSSIDGFATVETTVADIEGTMSTTLPKASLLEAPCKANDIRDSICEQFGDTGTKKPQHESHGQTSPDNAQVRPDDHSIPKGASDSDPQKSTVTPGFARPVMIHRGILGSFERFIAILCEHLYGRWPFWLSPRQILIIPVTGVVHEYATEVQKRFTALHMHTDVDLSNNTLSKKIRAGQTHKYNFIFVVGRKERDTESVNVRNRDDPATHQRGALVPVGEALGKLNKLKTDRDLDGRIKFLTRDD